MATKLGGAVLPGPGLKPPLSLRVLSKLLLFLSAESYT